MLILLVLTGLVFLMHGLVAGKSSGFYTLYPMTLAFCLLGIGIEAVLTRAHAAPARLWATAGSLAAVAALLANMAIFSIGPRAAAFWLQGASRDYLQLEGLSSRLSPGNQVWGTAVAWLAVIKAGARLDAIEWVPRAVDPRPDPIKHKYVVVFRGDDFPGRDAYRKIAEIGTEPPRVLGASLTNKPYTFDLWLSQSMP